MRAEVLVLRGGRPRPLGGSESGLYTYAVPEPLGDRIRAGQLVSVPYRERLLPGIVWALDASDELAALPDGHPPRPLASVLIEEPLLAEDQRALAEWLANTYAAPLNDAARPLLPPGLAAGLRTILLPSDTLDRGSKLPAYAHDQSHSTQVPAHGDGTEVRGGGGPNDLSLSERAPALQSRGSAVPKPGTPDEAAVLGLLRERGRLELREVERALGEARSRAAVAALLAARRICRELEAPPNFLRVRRERLVRTAADEERLDAWRAAARTRLDALPPLPAHRPRWRKPAPEEREAERLLRQLAALDALARSERDQPEDAELISIWRVEELRRLTRITEAALAELVAAGLVEIVAVEHRADPLAGRRILPTTPLPLTAAQSAALEAIVAALPVPHAHQTATDRKPILLHGITGSGKTEIYLQALAAALKRGLRGIVLVPEIALTPQAVTRFAGRFPGRVALLHSGLTASERLSAWRSIRGGEVDVVIGSRSALFAPVPNLGLIVVDEEHEVAYKQEHPRPTYHARDVAVRLGALSGAAVVLGSATPSVESYARALAGDFTLLELTERAPVAAMGVSADVVLIPMAPSASPPVPQSAQAESSPPNPLSLRGEGEPEETARGEGEPVTRVASDLSPARAGGLGGGTPLGADSSAGPSRGARDADASAGRPAADADTPADPLNASDQLAGPLTAPALPPVTLIDLRAELRAGNTSILSAPLRTALEQTLARGEQAILFLNRRGTASAVVCRECGYAARCTHCDVSLTYHATERILLCHYCGRREPEPRECPICHSASIRYFGLGTERVESAVKKMFPAARVLRWDRDTARTRHVHEELLRAFAERRADVLVGTQMIAKGLDLPAVTLVGVVSADVALFMPDFRANERAFQLLTQVAGRAGRGAAPGRVLVQTFNPEHFCIQAAARHDYAAFFAAEAAARQRFGYPPYRRFVKLTYEHADRYSAQIEATALAERLERAIRTLALPDSDLVGPAPAFIERLRGRYRWQLILRAPDPVPLLRALAPDDLPFGWSVDVDPASTL
ncbi:MAG TPA: primosomal protein N' [Ktedonobacterales bacterium]